MIGNYSAYMTQILAPTHGDGISREDRGKEIGEVFMEYGWPESLVNIIALFEHQQADYTGKWQVVAKMNNTTDFKYVIEFFDNDHGRLSFPDQNGFSSTVVDLSFFHHPHQWNLIYFYIDWVINGIRYGSSFVLIHHDEDGSFSGLAWQINDFLLQNNSLREDHLDAANWFRENLERTRSKRGTITLTRISDPLEKACSAL